MQSSVKNAADQRNQGCPRDHLRVNPNAVQLLAARLLGVDDRLGSVEEGKLADLVVVSGDACDFQDIGHRVAQVWKAGQRIAEGSPPQ